MASNGHDVAMVSLRSKAEGMVSFLDLVRLMNPPRDICIILDNTRIHHAKTATGKAAMLKINFTHLPPYSRDLNPIEFAWKDLKLEMSGILRFNKIVYKSRETVLRIFQERKTSYTKNWQTKFIDAEG